MGLGFRGACFVVFFCYFSMTIAFSSSEFERDLELKLSLHSLSLDQIRLKYYKDHDITLELSYNFKTIGSASMSQSILLVNGIKKSVAKISSVQLDPLFQHKGLGRAIYLALSHLAFEEWAVPLAASPSISLDARKLWHRLVRDGYSAYVHSPTSLGFSMPCPMMLANLLQTKARSFFRHSLEKSEMPLPVNTKSKFSLTY